MPESLKKLKNVIFSTRAQTSPFHIQIDKSKNGYSIIVSGVLRIEKFDEKEIKLKCRGFSITVRGTLLSLSLYENRCVEISGVTLGVDFSSAKN